MIRSEGLEEQFKRRYNRKVTIHSQNDIEGTEFVRGRIQITYRDQNFYLDEHLENGMTKFVILKHNNVTHTFKTHLEAEIYVADKIGEL